MTTMNQSMRVLTSNSTNEWYTPPGVIERARRCMGGIDLDPASNDTAQQWIKATMYYTASTPLQAAWAGRVWLNPPFDDTRAWVERLEREYTCGAVTAAVLLVNSAPGYVWWENLWRLRPVVLLRDRLRFIQANGQPGGQAKKGQTVAYFGTDNRAFIDAFGDLGRVVLP